MNPPTDDPAAAGRAPEPGADTEPLPATLARVLEGQARLEAGLLAARRRGRWLALLLVLSLGGLGWLYVDHMQRPPVLVEGQTVEADVDELLAQVETLQAKLDASRQERNKHLEEAQRLRQRLLEQERRVSDLTGGLDDLASAASRPPAPGPSVSSTAERPVEAHPAQPVNAALEASGVEGLTVVELDGVRDGRLHALLVADVDEQGLPVEVAFYDRAWLRSQAGLVSLILENEVVEGVEVAPLRRVPMPEIDLAAWRKAGLAVGEITTVAHVSAALSEFLDNQRFRVVTLGGWDGDVLIDLVLSERDEHGIELARYSAARAELLPVGPTLLLSDGTKLVDGSERPFWQGHVRLVLGGASYGRFLDALARKGDERG